MCGYGFGFLARPVRLGFGLFFFTGAECFSISDPSIAGSTGGCNVFALGVEDNRNAFSAATF